MDGEGKSESNGGGKRLFPTGNEIMSGDTLYKVTSVYADKGDFRVLWEELIIKAIQSETERAAS